MAYHGTCVVWRYRVCRSYQYWVQIAVCSAGVLLCAALGGNVWAQPYPLDTLAPKAAAMLKQTRLSFAYPVRFVPDIHAESGIPASELRLAYKFQGDERVEIAYIPNAEGMRVPGYARKVDVEVLRLTPAGEKIALWKHVFEPEQTLPEFHAGNVIIETVSGKSGRGAGKPNALSFLVKNLRVDFTKPVDVQGERVITALVDDLQVGEPSIDASTTELQLKNSSKPDAALISVVKPEYITCSGFFDAGVFLITITISKLPTRSLRGAVLSGTLGLRLSVTLLNRRAARAATAEETLHIPVVLHL